MSRGTLSWALLALLAFSPALAPPGQATGTAAPVVWWGPTDPTSGYHLRVPVSVENTAGVELQDPVASIDLDIPVLLRDAGWPMLPGSQRPQPASFELDLSSVRVVAMRNLLPPASGSADGKPEIYDAAQADPLARNVAPSMVVPGLLHSGNAAPFNAQTNPVITVFWKVQGRMPVDQVRSFVLYFDSLRNPGHDLAPPTGVEAGAAAALHGTGPSQVLYGFLPPPAGDEDSPLLTVLSLHPGTTVQVHVEQGGYRPFAARPTLSFAQAFQRQTLDLGAGEDGTAFRLTSNLPVLAYSGVHGFVPSLQGGFAASHDDDANARPHFVFQAGDRAAYFMDAGTGAETTIAVTPVSGGGTLTFKLNGQDMGENPLPFTVGTWAAQQPTGNCQPNPRPGEAPPLTVGTLYRATVTEGGPVLLQQGTFGPLSPVPALDGGPAGRTFAATVGDSPLQSLGNCVVVPRERIWHASSPSGASIHAIDTRTTPGSALPDRTVPAAPATAGGFRDGATARDRPAGFAATAPTWLWLGDPGTGVTPAMGGPLNGLDARRFAGMGEAIAFGLYDETKVTVSETRAAPGQSPQTTSRQEALAAGETLRLEDGGGQRLVSYRLEADRPIAVYPTTGLPSMLAGLPFTLTAEPRPLEFRGYLVDLDPVPGTPTTKSTTPGVPVTYQLRLTNLGRTATGAPLPDIVDMSVRSLSEGWTATFDGQPNRVVALGGGGKQDLTLTVTPPGDAEARSQAVTLVTATSRGNPDVQVTVKVTTYIKRAFDVGLWFDVAGGPKDQPRNVDPTTGTADFVLVVRNEGTVEDRILLATSPPERGWSVLLHQGGVDVEELALEAGETRTLGLRVKPPADALEGTLLTTVTASSSAQASSFDRVTATTHLKAPSNLTAVLTPTTLLGEPGKEALFDIELTNSQGAGAAELRLENRSSAPAGWPVPSLFLEQPGGQRLPLDRITVAAGETLRLRFGLTVPEDSPAGELAFFRVAGRGTDGALAFEVLPVIATAPVHNLTLLHEPELTLGPGAADNVTLEIHNGGNLDELALVRVASAPLGWTVAPATPLVVALGENQSLPVQVEVPRSAPAGSYAIALLAVSTDGAAQFLTLTATVPLGSSEVVGEAGGIEAQPGGEATTLVPIENSGNTPLTVHLDAPPGEPWGLEEPEPLALAPGENATVAVTWLVPRSAPDGRSTHTAVLRFESGEDGVLRTSSVQAAVEVGRPALRVRDLETVDTPGGRLVRFWLENAGDRAAIGLEVQLESGGKARDLVRVDAIAPGESVALALLDPVGTGPLEVVLDPDDRIADAPPEGNLLSEGGGDRSSPGAPVLLLAVLVLAATWCARKVGNDRANRVK